MQQRARIVCVRMCAGKSGAEHCWAHSPWTSCCSCFKSKTQALVRGDARVLINMYIL